MSTLSWSLSWTSTASYLRRWLRPKNNINRCLWKTTLAMLDKSRKSYINICLLFINSSQAPASICLGIAKIYPDTCELNLQTLISYFWKKMSEGEWGGDWEVSPAGSAHWHPWICQVRDGGERWVDKQNKKMMYKKWQDFCNHTFSSCTPVLQLHLHCWCNADAADAILMPLKLLMHCWCCPMSIYRYMSLQPQFSVDKGKICI